MRIGIVRERKKNRDFRTPLTPKQCMLLMANYKQLEIIVEPSDDRCFSDDEYLESGVILDNNLSNCDVILGVKEIPIDNLLPNKTYFFFSHTIKKQEYNRQLLQALVQNKIRMIDYECLKYPDGKRIIGFGEWAGIVGSHNGLLDYGLKTNSYQLQPAYEFRNFNALKDYYANLSWPAIKIAVTGSGRVAQGVLQIMNLMDAVPVTLSEFQNNSITGLQYLHLNLDELYVNKETGGYDKNEFFENPELYECTFRPLVASTDLLINGVYWNSQIDRLFDTDMVDDSDFNIQVIADISCDYHGSVPINIRSSSIANPSYGIEKSNLHEVPPYLIGDDTVDVMAVDNLPNELPRDASEDFGKMMMDVILPELFQKDSEILDRATICRDGHLTPDYTYLSDFIHANH